MVFFKKNTKLYPDFNIDIFASVICLILGSLIVFVPFFKSFHQEDIGLTIIFSCGTYLIIKKLFKKSRPRQSCVDSKNLIITFLLLSSFSLYLLQSNLYFRPASYFIIISILSAIIAIGIFFTKLSSHLLMLKIILLSLIIRYGIFYEFHGLGSGDIWLHSRWIEEIINSSQLINQMGLYFDYPLFHLNISMCSIICSISVKNGIFMVGVFPFVFSSYFIYLIGRNLVDEKLSLLSVLLFNVSDIAISKSVITIDPSLMVYPLFLTMLYLLLKKTENKAPHKLILILTIIAMNFVHQLSVFVSLIILFSIFIHNIFYTKLHEKKFKFTFLNIFIIFSVTLLFRWIYAGTYHKSFFNFAMGPIQHMLLTEKYIADSTGNAVAIFSSGYTLFSNILFHFGYLLLTFFIIIGTLHFLSQQKRSIDLSSVFFALVIIYGLIYVLPLTGFGNSAITTRWIIFSYYLGIFFASIGIHLLMNCFRKNKIVLFILLSIFTYFMITTPYINSDSPMYLEERWPRLFFKDSELIAANTIVSFSTQEIQSIDASYSILRYYIELDQRLNSSKKIFIVRKIDEPMVMQTIAEQLSVIRIPYLDEFNIFYSEEYYHIYNGGDVQAFLQVK